MASSDRILVGVIGAPHGVRGALRVKPYTADPQALASYGPLASEDGVLTLAVESARLQGDMLVVQFAGVTDRDAAASLTGTRLYVPRARLPEPEPDEFYHADLIGLRLEDRAGTGLGTIAAVMNFGAGDLLEVKPAGGGATVYLPFTRAFVPDIDLAGGRVIAEPPEGLFEPDGPGPTAVTPPSEA
jgi:16S rRNA processing protein RimM